MTHEEAAIHLERQVQTSIMLNNKDRLAMSIAATILRSVATASADAEKSWKAWLSDNPCHQVGALSWLPREAYLAGHAAATAARQAEVDSLIDEAVLQNDYVFGLEKQIEQLRADLDDMCGECERMEQWITDGTLRVVKADRQPRVSAILAQRKPAPPQQEG